MSLKTKISDLITSVTTNLNDSRTWAETEFAQVYTTINDVVSTIPVNNSELVNDSDFIKGENVVVIWRGSEALYNSKPQAWKDDNNIIKFINE